MSSTFLLGKSIGQFPIWKPNDDTMSSYCPRFRVGSLQMQCLMTLSHSKKCVIMWLGLTLGRLMDRLSRSGISCYTTPVYVLRHFELMSSAPKLGRRLVAVIWRWPSGLLGTETLLSSWALVSKCLDKSACVQASVFTCSEAFLRFLVPSRAAQHISISGWPCINP